MKNLMFPIIFIIAVKCISFASDDILYLKYPAGGESFFDNDYVHIHWIQECDTCYLDIHLWDGDASEWYLIDSAIIQVNGYYNWSIPQGLNGDCFRIKLSSRATQAFSMSRGYFAIHSNQQLISAIQNIDISVAEVSFHPNPFRDYLIISSETNEIIGISILNMIGHRIYGSKCFAKDARINTSFLQPGVYFFVIQKSNFAQFFFKAIKY